MFCLNLALLLAFKYQANGLSHLVPIYAMLGDTNQADRAGIQFTCILFLHYS